MLANILPRRQGRPPLVGPGGRDQRRAAFHRRNGRRAIRRHRLCRQRNDFRHVGRHDGPRLFHGQKIPGKSSSAVDRKKIRGGAWQIPQGKRRLSLLLSQRPHGRRRGNVDPRRPSRRRQDPEDRWPPRRLFARRAGKTHAAFGRVHPHGLRRPLEQCRTNLGLPLPRIAISSQWRSPGRARPNSRCLPRRQRSNDRAQRNACTEETAGCPGGKETNTAAATRQTPRQKSPATGRSQTRRRRRSAAPGKGR